MKKSILIGISTSLLLSASLAGAAEHTVSQKNKAFSAKELRIKVGDKVHFKNEDPFFHNIYSLSDLQMFDLGSYPQGESRDVVFEKAGTIPVECAIHPNMQMNVIVE